MFAKRYVCAGLLCLAVVFHPTENAKAADGAWSRLQVAPPSLFVHSAIYDPLRHRLIVFGGADGASIESGDTWSLSLDGIPQWIPIAAMGPGSRQNHTAIYDPVRDRMIVFGGFGPGVEHNDTWALSLTGSPTWSQLATTGQSPPPMNRHTAIYDPVRDRMIIFGGYSHETWALTLADPPTWTHLFPAGAPPPDLKDHAAIYDPERDRMLVFGGGEATSGNDVTYNDVWSLTLSGNPGWSKLSPSGVLPQAREQSATIYDSNRDRLIVFGGVYSGETSTTVLNDTWALNLTGPPSWEALAPLDSLPDGQLDHAAIYDSELERMIVFGGQRSPSTAWQLPLTTGSGWSSVISTEQPAWRSEASMIFDALRERAVVFGGRQYSRFGDSFRLSFVPFPEWSRLGSDVPRPTERYGQSAVYDSLRDRMVMFGGYDGSYRADVWSLGLSGSAPWSDDTPGSVAPSGRADHSMIYDARRDELVVFGGYDGAFRNDTWVLSLSGNSKWKELTPGGSAPSPRSGHSAIYNPNCDEMLVFGGHATEPLNDVWSLSLSGASRWTRLVPSGAVPQPRFGHVALRDDARSRMLVFGGSGAFSTQNDTWSLSLCDSSAWTALGPSGGLPQRRTGHAAAYDPAGDRMIVFGGATDPGVFPPFLNDVWVLALGSSTVDVPTPRAESKLELRVSPNPMQGDLRVTFALPVESIVSLNVYDIRGRWVATLAQGVRRPGRYGAIWTGYTETGAAGSGIYFVRLRAAGANIVKRVMLVR